MKYRPEIDALRCLAVCPVILFHAGFSAFSGGYVGVDIFFVISGYLITSILLAEISSRRFSFVGFYERRARRILPALYFMLLIIMPFSWLYMLPDPLENFGQSLVATIFFSNNILLTITSGYWEAASEFKPLVHMWSLGVEEQFYVVFPVLLMILWRFNFRRIYLPIIFIFFVSLCIAEYGIINFPNANFYLLPSRAWELLAGSMVAVYLFSIGDVRGNDYLGMAGVLMIFYAIFFYDSETPFPSFYTLVPVAGTVLIILFIKQGTLLHRVIANRAFVGIGLVSYSAYLWHQPILAFLRIYSQEEPGLYLMCFAVGLTFLAAYISWRFVEAPFRSSATISRKVVGVCVVVFSTIIVGVGYSAHYFKGFPGRFYSADVVEKPDLYIAYNKRAFDYVISSFDNDGKVKVLVLGDSFARDFINMMVENLRFENIQLGYKFSPEDCLLTPDDATQALVNSADVVVYAFNEGPGVCARSKILALHELGVKVYYLGTKNFGYNLNWLARIDPAEREGAFNNIVVEMANIDDRALMLLPSENYLSVMSKISTDASRVPITDRSGFLLTADRKHLTKYGARFVGKLVLDNQRFLNDIHSSLVP
ncbi:acyltransferase family protein [Zhongshania guokunii]|uniref:Acyltransferase family protein n=1 Tax=Zhongshania guokunii TaxID=641783 RepID=A0ABV3U9L5_9GAMM